MRKILVSVLFFGLCGFFLVGALQQSGAQKEDPMDSLSLIDQIEPVQDFLKIGFESITGKDAMNYLGFISSDLLEGRDTATRGYAIAAEYAAAMFELWGLQPAGDFVRPQSMGMFGGSQPSREPKRGYYQNIAFKEVISQESHAVVEWRKGNQAKSRAFQAGTDFSYSSSETGSLSAPVVFVGYGLQEESLKLDEYKNLDVKGKIVMMLSETPGKDDPESPFSKGELKAKYYPERRMRRMSNPKTALAEKLGAVAILMVENSPETNGDLAGRAIARRAINDENPIYPGGRRRLQLIGGRSDGMPWDSLPTISLSRDAADAVLGLLEQNIEGLKSKIETTMKSHSMELTGVTFTVKSKVETELVGCKNVLAYLEGSDPELKNEVVVIGAHLDHLGKRGDYIFNGADDNGSGSVGVMEVAEAFSKNPVKPKRSVLFALWTGEEKGLYGSRYYTYHPFFPMEKTVVCLNLDMISREASEAGIQRMARMFGGEMPKEVKDKIDMKNFISLSYDANTPELGELLKANNRHVGLSLQLRGSENASGGSDHAPFGQMKRPWVFFFASMTEDYHQASDSIEKVSPSLMEKIIRLTYLTAHKLADK